MSSRALVLAQCLEEELRTQLADDEGRAPHGAKTDSTP